LTGGPASPTMAGVDGAPLLAVRGLEKRYGLAPVLKGLDLELFPGEILLLLGPNGAGKTTLTRVITLLSRPGRGELAFGGAKLDEKGRLALRRAVGYLSHQSFLYAHLTAEENLRFFGGLYGVAEMGLRIPDLLAQVGLTRARHQLAGTFSRGMQQRLTLARVLLTDPTLVILDEPYAGLDPEGSRTFTELMRALKSEHRAVLLVSHEIDDCLSAVDRIALLHGGKIAWQAPSAGLTPEAVKRTYFEVTGGGA